ncbi:MAG: NB-ARC domain-containing protein, partial [Phormidesmis sp.]
MSRDALIVGINQYPKDLLSPFSAPANDAEGVAQVLAEYGDFLVKRLPETRIEPYQVCGETKVKSGELKRAIAQLLNPKGKQIPHTVLLYFSGHGWQDSQEDTVDCYLATSDIDPDEDKFGVSFDWLKKQLEQSKVRQQIVILDCCNSGDLLNFETVISARKGESQVRYFITACRDIEPAYTAADGVYSIFTKSLIDGLHPSRMPNGKVTNTDLTQYLEQTLRGEPQKPQCIQTGAIDLTVTTQTIAPVPEAPEPKRYAPRQGEKLPANYVPRPEPFEAVKTVLLKEATTTNTLVVSAILGLGGIGKSVLAAALAADPEIQQRFPDGTLWVTLGQNPDLLPMLGDWIQALGDYNYKPLTPEAASAHLRTLLYDRQMLLVVDDVWNPVHLDPFRVGGAGSCVLVTTREAKITDAQKYDLDVMTHDQAMALLTSKFGTALTEEEAQQAGAFAKRVGYLPLALELATAQIEEGLTWEELLNDFRQEVDRLETLDVLGKEDLPDDAERRKYSLLACFNLSLQRLTPEQQACFAWLGVLPEDADITQQMGKTLWQLTERQAGGVLKTFRGKALLKGERPTYRLHDLMHDLARQLLTSPTAPEKVGSLVGLGVTEPEAHGQLLARYRQQTEAGQWHTLTADGHIYVYLTWHMLQAEVPQQIHELLQETTEAGRNGWYEACDAIGKPALFASDVGRGWQLASADCDHLAWAIPLQVRYAFIRASLNSMANNIPGPMVGGLLKAKKWQPAQALAYAQQTQDPWRRAEYLAELAPYTTPALLPEVQNVLAQIHDMSYRSFALARLAPYFPELWSAVMDSITQIQDEVGFYPVSENGFPRRAVALSQVVPYLPEGYFPQALALTSQINDRADQISALSEIAQYLPELWEMALALTRQISDESDRARVLSTVAQYLPEHLWEEVLTLTRQISDESDRARVLSTVAQYLPE